MIRIVVIIAAAVVFCIAAAVAMAQEQRPGVGVDSRGGGVIDPTENVKALNAAEAKRQDDLRGWLEKFTNAMRDKDAQLQTALREAESKMRDALAAQKQAFDFELARVLKSTTDEKSQLLAAQVLAIKADTDARLAKQEQFRWETGGRSDQGVWIVMLILAIATIAGPIITAVVMKAKRA